MAHPLPPRPPASAVFPRPSKHTPVPLILSSFPAPPSHIPINPPPPPPSNSNPPPTGPPSSPLPPLPSGPSRISDHGQLLLLSSLRRSSTYSQRDSITINGTPNRDSVISSHPSRPQHVHHKSMADPIDPQMLPLGLQLEDPRPPPTPSPAAASFSPLPSPSKIAAIYYSHSPQRSLSESYRLGHARSTSTVTTVVAQNHTRSLSNSSAADTGSPPLRSGLLQNTDSKLTDSYSTTTQFSNMSSDSLHTATGEQPGREHEVDLDNDTLSVVPLHHHHSLSQVDLGGIVVTKTTTTTTSIQANGRGTDEMTLDELGLPQSPRVPSPDIATILSVTPRPALSLSRSRSAVTRSKSRSKSGALPGQRRVASTTTHPDRNRRQSEGTPTTNAQTIPANGINSSSELAYLHKRSDTIASGAIGLPNGSRKSLSRSTSTTAAELNRSSSGGYYEQEVEDYDEALEKVLEGRGSEDEEDAEAWARHKRRGRQRQGRGSDSDSSLDLHTPLPHLMVRHGLLSPNSKLLPQAECSRAATPSDERPGSIMSLVSNGSKSGVVKDERDTATRRVRHRDGKLLRGGLGLTTGLGWSDSEDEDAPSPLTRRLSTLNLSRRSSASSIRSANLPPFPSPSLSTSLSSSSLRRLHPLSRSYSSGAILETEPEPNTFGSYDSYSYTYDDEDEEEEEEEPDHTLEESGQCAQRNRLGVSSSKTSSSSPPVSWQRRPRQPPQPRNRRNQQTSLGTRTSTSSVGSTFSLEVTIPEGGENERSKTPSRLRRPSSRASVKSTSIGAGGRDSSGSSSLDNPSSGLSSNFSPHQRRSGGDDNYNNNNNSGNTPSSTSSTLSIPMPATPKDIFDPAAPPLFSSTRGMLANREKSLPPLPAGGMKRKTSGISNGHTTGTGKYAFPSTRVRTFSATSAASISTPSQPNTNMTSTTTAAGTLSSSSSAATIQPHVRPLQLPRHPTSRSVGDRPAVPVPSPSVLHSPPLPNNSPLTITTTTNNNNNMNSGRSPQVSPITSRTTTLLGPSSSSSSSNPNPNPNTVNMIATTATPTAGRSVRPKPRTGTGMVYRTSSYGNSKMRAPMMMLSQPSSSSGGGVSSGGGGGNGNGNGNGSGNGSGSTGGGGGGIPRAIAL